jgi:hypothetical protein
MNENDNNIEHIRTARGARPCVVFVILVIPILVVGLLSMGHKQRSRSVESSLVQTTAQSSASLPDHQRSSVRTVAIQPTVSDVAPETEAALAQFGLSATSVVKISVVAHSRPPIILPNPVIQKRQ